MNLLAGDLNPTQGEQRRSHKLRVGRYAQHFVDALRYDETPVEYLLMRHGSLGAHPASRPLLLAPLAYARQWPMLWRPRGGHPAAAADAASAVACCPLPSRLLLTATILPLPPTETWVKPSPLAVQG